MQVVYEFMSKFSNLNFQFETSFLAGVAEEL